MALSRRQLLKRLGWAGAGLVVVAGGGCAALPMPAFPHDGLPTPKDTTAWLRLTPDGLIELVMPRAEMGQGIAIAFRQIVAEETGFALERIRAIEGRTDILPVTSSTNGSESVENFALVLAQASAALREMLKQAGSQGGLPPPAGWASLAGKSRLIETEIVNIGREQLRSFGKGPKRFVGTSQPTDGVRAIVTGEAPLYADDVRLPNLAFAAVLRAPRLGASLVSVDDSSARALAGYLGLHRVDERAFVAASSRSALERALAVVRATWTGGLEVSPDLVKAVSVESALAKGALEHVEQKAEFASDERFDIDLTLEVPAAAHAQLEPRVAVASFEGDALTVWTGTQDVTFVRSAVSKALRMPLEKVKVIGCRVGGSFGLRMFCTVEIEAALAARAIGRPVKIQWTRQEEFRQSFHRPPSSHRIRARLAADGRIEAWHHAFRSGHVIFSSALMGPTLQFVTSFTGDPGVSGGAAPPYATGKTRIEFEDVRLPLDTGPWRGLGAGPNSWATETAIDQLARKRGEDPYLFRKRNAVEPWPRLARALDRVAAVSGWSRLQSTPERGYGMACGVYKGKSYAAAVAEVTRIGAAMKVTRLWCAHDCGMVVNPDQVRAQVEGNLVWGIGMALSEELTLANAHVRQSSFADYVVPRFSDVPEMIVDLIDEGESPTGAGETAIVAAAPAITNAIAAMTGQPVRRLPWRAG